MPPAPLPKDESFRLATLHGYGLADGRPVPQLDRIARIAAAVLGLPHAMVSLVYGERQCFAGSNLDCRLDHTSREVSFCAHALTSDAAEIVPDAAADPRFADNPLVRNGIVRTYVGVPLIAPNGMRLGMLCGVGPSPAPVPGEAVIAALRDLAVMAVNELEALRGQTRSEMAARDDATSAEVLRGIRDRVEMAHAGRNEFLRTLSHELRTPLQGILGFAELIGTAQGAGSKVKSYANEVTTAGQRLRDVINDVILLSSNNRTACGIDRRKIDFSKVVADAVLLAEGFAFSRHVRLSVKVPPQSHAFADPSRTKEVLLQVITNAIKGSRSGGEVDVWLDHPSCTEVRLNVRNHGPALSPGEIEQSMTPIGQPCRSGLGTGLGLPIARMIVERQGGRLDMTSTQDSVTVAIVLHRDASELGSAADPASVTPESAFHLQAASA